MRKFEVISAVAASLLRANVDTDAIIPSREMKSLSKTGLADGLFAGWRYTAAGGREPDPHFVLNQPAYRPAQILLTGENFGCGSSREHAVWALHEYGFRAVIAPSFAPIFHSNCVRNGIAPVRLAQAAIAQLAAVVAQDPSSNRVTVDLHARTVSLPGVGSFVFDIDAQSRQLLLQGLDPIDLTLSKRPLIDAFVSRDRIARPWIYLDAPSEDRGNS
jgi:3-isopropylmalate/(R)-2-methylmalate dehydratase small subunit